MWIMWKTYVNNLLLTIYKQNYRYLFFYKIENFHL